MKKILLSILALSILLPTLAFASFDTSLKYGSRGDAVLELQDLLIAQGFLKGNSDGRYGLVTLNAVKAFQTANGLSSDGYFGKASRAKASSILADQLQSSNTAEQADTGTITPATPTTSSAGGGGGGASPGVMVGPCPIVGPCISAYSVLSTNIGCTSNIGFSPTTGQPCSSTTQPTSTNLPVGCTSTFGFSVTTGQACNNLVSTVQQLQQTVQQQAQTIQQIQQNTQQIVQNTTPLPTPVVTSPASQASIKIYETIERVTDGKIALSGIDLVNISASTNVSHVIFTIKSFDKDGRQVDSLITVSTNDPDLPSTFTIKANMGFYVGNHGTNLPQSDCSPDDHDCVPKSVGTFNFTFTNPELNVSKSVILNIEANCVSRTCA